MLRFCTQCHSHLCEKGSPCITLWEAICEVYEEGKLFTITSAYKYIEVIKYLEQEGYVISTETRTDEYQYMDFIFIKPNHSSHIYRGIYCNHLISDYE